MQPTKEQMLNYVTACLKIGVTINAGVNAIRFYGWEESSKLVSYLVSKGAIHYGDRFLAALKNRASLPKSMGQLLGMG